MKKLFFAMLLCIIGLANAFEPFHRWRAEVPEMV